MQVVIAEAELKRFTGVDELLIPDDAVVTLPPGIMRVPIGSVW